MQKWPKNVYFGGPTPQARKKSTKINFLGPETARWGGGLPLERLVAENFVPALESLSSLGFEERNLGCPGNVAGMSRTPGGVQKVCALFREIIPQNEFCPNFSAWRYEFRCEFLREFQDEYFRSILTFVERVRMMMKNSSRNPQQNSQPNSQGQSEEKFTDFFCWAGAVSIFVFCCFFCISGFGRFLGSYQACGIVNLRNLGSKKRKQKKLRCLPCSPKTFNSFLK